MEWNGTDENKITNSSTEAIKERKHLRATVTALEDTGRKKNRNTNMYTHWHHHGAGAGGGCGYYTDSRFPVNV